MRMLEFSNFEKMKFSFFRMKRKMTCVIEKENSFERVLDTKYNSIFGANSPVRVNCGGKEIEEWIDNEPLLKKYFEKGMDTINESLLERYFYEKLSRQGSQDLFKIVELGFEYNFTPEFANKRGYESTKVKGKIFSSLDSKTYSYIEEWDKLEMKCDIPDIAIKLRRWNPHVALIYLLEGKNEQFISSDLKKKAITRFFIDRETDFYMYEYNFKLRRIIEFLANPKTDLSIISMSRKDIRLFFKYETLLYRYIENIFGDSFIEEDYKLVSVKGIKNRFRLYDNGPSSFFYSIRKGEKTQKIVTFFKTVEMDDKACVRMFSIKPEKIFMYGYHVHGNSMLLKMNNNEYLLFVHGLHYLKLEDDEIFEFKSLLGNSGVPYCIGFGVKYNYYFTEEEKLPSYRNVRDYDSYYFGNKKKNCKQSIKIEMERIASRELFQLSINDSNY